MLTTSDIPDRLQNIPQPPQKLFIKGNLLSELLNRPCVSVVGSRKVSAYGKAVTMKLVTDLARAGVVIVSGLAIGVDGLAHRAALDAGGLTIAVMPCGLDMVYPTSHTALAERILRQGGALISEYPEGIHATRWTFIERNRLVSGLSDAVLITEAGEKSGTLHTARFALDQGREVLAVPGNITSPNSAGANNLLKTGATPVTGSADIFHVLGIRSSGLLTAPTGDTPEEQTILNLIHNGTSDGEELLVLSKLAVPTFSQTITMLEITGKVRALGANKWALQ
jgi:DNA processing protein